MCVCMCVCVCVCVFVCVCGCAQVHVHVYVHACTYLSKSSLKMIQEDAKWRKAAKLFQLFISTSLIGEKHFISIVVLGEHFAASGLCINMNLESLLLPLIGCTSLRPLRHFECFHITRVSNQNGISLQ